MTILAYSVPRYSHGSISAILAYFAWSYHSGTRIAVSKLVRKDCTSICHHWRSKALSGCCALSSGCDFWSLTRHAYVQSLLLSRTNRVAARMEHGRKFGSGSDHFSVVHPSALVPRLKSFNPDQAAWCRGLMVFAPSSFRETRSELEGMDSILTKPYGRPHATDV